jgi:H3 lysine-79-specific histone-lysine N-methyltransferase
MSIFNQKSKFKVKTEVRKVKQAVEPTPEKKRLGNGSASASTHGTPRASPIPSSSSLHVKRLRPAASPATTTKPSLSSSASLSALDSTRKRRRGPASSGSSRSPATASPAPPALSDSEPGSDDDDDDWRERLDPSKRRKRAHTEDPDRRLRHPRLWTGQGEEEKPGIVHAVQVASLDDKCQPVMKLGRDEVGVRLRYPGAKYTER